MPKILSRRLLLNTLVLAFVYSTTSIGAESDIKPKTIVFVRHGERMAPTGDVGLSEKGRQRATTLAYVLNDFGLQSIFTSQMIRTIQTAEPIARALKLKPEVVPAEQLDALVDSLNKLPQGQKVLVVHHSNTIPQLVEKLGGGTIPPIPEDEFDRMVIVTIYGTGSVSVAILRYGGR